MRSSPKLDDLNGVASTTSVRVFYHLVAKCRKQIVGKRMRVSKIKGFTFLFALALLVLN